MTPDLPAQSPEHSGRGSTHALATDATRNVVRTFQRVTTSMYASSGLNQTLQVIANGVIQLVGFRSAVVGVALEAGGFEYVAFNGPAEVRTAMQGATMSREQWAWRLGNCVRWGSLCWIDHRVTWPDFMTAWIPDRDMVGADAGDPDAWDPEDLLFAPLLGPDGQALGVLSVDLPVDGRKPDAAQLELLELFAESAALALRQAMLVDQLHEQHRLSQHMARHDPLTGLANRTALNAEAADLIASSAGPVGAFVVDLDHFKDVNDEFGHAAGDEVLVVVAQRMSRVLRNQDVLARTGGDEFVAVVAGSEGCTVMQLLLDRLHSVIAAPIEGRAGTYHVGASIGMAIMPSPVTLAELLQTADADMYRLKRARRRRPQLQLNSRREQLASGANRRVTDGGTVGLNATLER